MNETTPQSDTVINAEIIPAPAIQSKAAIKAATQMVVYRGHDLETRSRGKSKDDKKKKKGGLASVFYKDSKITPVGYTALGVTASLSVVLFLKIKKERSWSKQKVAVGTRVMPLMLNTNSEHIKGLLHA